MKQASIEQSKWITSTRSDRFEGDVLQRSHELPVVVDFWLPGVHLVEHWLPSWRSWQKNTRDAFSS